MTEPTSTDVMSVRDLEASLADHPVAHAGSRLLRRRRRLTLAVVLVVGGSIGLSAAYAVYLRSQFYRDALTHRLSERLGLAITCAEVRQVGLQAHQLADVRVFLNEPRLGVFECDRAEWRRSDSPLRSGFVLDLIDGSVLIGAVDWPQSRYGRLLRSSFGQDFAALHLVQARLRNIDLRFATPLGDLTAAGTRGIVNVSPSGEAVASLDGFDLNGIAVDDSINIAARFTPGSNLRFSDVRLTIPSVPMRAFAFDHSIPATKATGTFRGTIVYSQSPEASVVDVTGAIRNASLVNLTHGLPKGPYRGKVDLDVRQASLINQKLDVLHASGHVVDFYPADVFPGLAAESEAATLSLDVADLQWQRDRITYLSTTGAARGLSLDALTRILGPGRITGSARMDIARLTIVDDKITYADLTIEAVQPADGPGMIDRAVLAVVAERWLGVRVESFLPASVEYERLGARFIIDGDELRIAGTHGPDQTKVLTVRLFGQSVALLAAPDRVFEAPDLVAAVRANVRNVETEDLRSWLEAARSGGVPPSESDTQ